MNNEITDTRNFTIENNIIKGEIRPIPETNLHFGQLLLDVFRKNPNHVFQIDAITGKGTTFQEIHDLSIKCAVWLNKQNIKTGDVVAISSNHSLEQPIPMFATFLVGAIHNPWEVVTILSARRLLKLTEPKIIFSEESNIEVLAEAAESEGYKVKLICFTKHDKYESLEDILNSVSDDEVKSFKPKKLERIRDPALLVFSSGTTGLPKGVVLPYETLEKNYLASYNFPVFPVKNSVIMWYMYPSWARGVMVFLKGIVSEATRIIHNEFNADETAKIIEKYKVNWLFTGNYHMTLLSNSGLLKTHPSLFKTLKVYEIGGDKRYLKAFCDVKNSMSNGTILNTIAMTEAGVVYLSQTTKCEIEGSLGFISANTLLRVVDEEGNNLGPNKPGELLVKHPIMMIGYLNNPEATEQLIDKDGWMHTGDRVSYNENGEFIFHDRIKEMIKFREYNVSPTELQQHILTLPDVIEVAVVPMPHHEDEQRPIAFVKKVPGSKLTEEDIIKKCAELASYDVLCGGVKFLDELPHSAAGKISRNVLKQMAKELSNIK